MTTNFKVGDLVRFKPSPPWYDKASTLSSNAVGKVLKVGPSDLYVSFEGWSGGHGQSYSCWNCIYTDIVLAQEPTPEMALIQKEARILSKIKYLDKKFEDRKKAKLSPVTKAGSWPFILE